MDWDSLSDVYLQNTYTDEWPMSFMCNLYMLFLLCDPYNVYSILGCNLLCFFSLSHPSNLADCLLTYGITDPRTKKVYLLTSRGSYLLVNS